MLQVIDDGVSITLNGKDGNPLFVMSGVLICLAIGVAVVAMVASVQVTIGVMAIFAVLVFGFNLYKQRLQYQSHVMSGQIIIKNRTFIIKGQSITLSCEACIEIFNDKLIITDLGRSWHIGGFDDVKEIYVAKSVLEGRALEKQERAIRIL